MECGRCTADATMNVGSMSPGGEREHLHLCQTPGPTACGRRIEQPPTKPCLRNSCQQGAALFWLTALHAVAAPPVAGGKQGEELIATIRRGHASIVEAVSSGRTSALVTITEPQKNRDGSDESEPDTFWADFAFKRDAFKLEIREVLAGEPGRLREVHINDGQRVYGFRPRSEYAYITSAGEGGLGLLCTLS